MVRLYCREGKFKGARKFFWGCYWCRLCGWGWVLNNEGGFGVFYSPVEYVKMWKGRGIRFRGFFCPLRDALVVDRRGGSVCPRRGQ